MNLKVILTYFRIAIICHVVMPGELIEFDNGVLRVS